MSTVITGVIVLALVVLAVRNIIKSKKSGKSIQCGGDCSQCGGHCH